MLGCWKVLEGQTVDVSRTGRAGSRLGLGMFIYTITFSPCAFPDGD